MIVISGEGLSLADIGTVARGEKVRLTDDATVLDRVESSRRYIEEAVERGEQIYGVTTLYGGMADHYIPASQLRELQKIALWHHKSTTGPRLPAQ
jgi:phenylalanine ammonia-lyase